MIQSREYLNGKDIIIWAIHSNISRLEQALKFRGG